jgi:hypothetical protein
MVVYLKALRQPLGPFPALLLLSPLAIRKRIFVGMLYETCLSKRKSVAG